MSSETVRSTLYFEPGLHQALRIKAATAHRSMSKIVNDAVRAALREAEEDLAAFAERERESARRLARLGGSEPALRPVPRRQTAPA